MYSLYPLWFHIMFVYRCYDIDLYNAELYWGVYNITSGMKLIHILTNIN